MESYSNSPIIITLLFNNDLPTVSKGSWFLKTYKIEWITSIHFQSKWSYHVETQSKSNDEEEKDDKESCEGHEHISEHDHVNPE